MDRQRVNEKQSPLSAICEMKYFLTLLALLTGCTTLHKQVAANRPQALKFEYISLPGVSIETYELLPGGRLLYEVSSGGRRLEHRISSPGEARWNAFYQTLDRLHAGEWCRKYSCEDADSKTFVSDGMQWHFSFHRRGMVVCASGDNAVPGIDHPKDTVSDMETVFFSKKNSLYVLRAALVALAGQRTR